MKSFLERANAVANYGFPVIPLSPRTKIAFIRGWCNHATTDEVQITEWNKENPNYNCAAVAKNEAGWIWDVDNTVVFEQLKSETGHSIDELKTLIVRSSGEKRHFYFRHDDCSRAMGNRDCDIQGHEAFSVRANNRYVVGPGSIHPETGLQYEIINAPLFDEILVAPHWLTEWIMRQTVSGPTSAPPATGNETIPEGRRDKALFDKAKLLRDAGLSIDDATVELKKINLRCCKPPMSDAVVEAKVKSAYSRGPRTAHGVEPAEDEPGLQFNTPKVTRGGHRDYVIAPCIGQTDGWFPLGALSVVCGSSGGGKTTLVYQMLLRQALGAESFGHETYGRPFVTMGVDRGEDAHKRTLERMHLSLASMAFEPLPVTAWDTEAGQAIASRIESTNPLPEVVFVEGLDMLVSEANDIKTVTRFAHALNTIAEHFHIALIGSAGAPKSKEGQGYTATRDNVFGSSGWGRVSETVALLQFPKNDDTSDQRKLTVVLSNGPSERFNLGFVDGCLEVQPDTPKGNVNNLASRLADEEITWFKEQARLAKTDTTKRWWTILDMERALHVPHASADRHVKDACTKQYIVRKRGTTKGRGRGGAAEYCWNESANNPLWVEERKQEVAQRVF